MLNNMVACPRHKNHHDQNSQRATRMDGELHKRSSQMKSFRQSVAVSEGEQFFSLFLLLLFLVEGDSPVLSVKLQTHANMDNSNWVQ